MPVPVLVPVTVGCRWRDFPEDNGLLNEMKPFEFPEFPEFPVGTSLH